MEAMQLVDRLERLLVEGLHIPLTANVIVNEEECLQIVDRLRAVLQEEARKGTAASGAAKPEPVVVGPVPPPIPPELAQHDLVKAARAHADQIIAEAQKQAEELKADADNYVLEELQQLQVQLEGLLRRVRNGIRKLEREGALAARRSREEQEE
ncbi:MAG: hypothetical protein H5T59_05825 [Anaerolineae bacterium]|nr:hypothetical protein [Anaerolineae bacterium]